MSQVPPPRLGRVAELRHLVEKRCSQAAACAWLAVAFTTVFDVLGRSLFGAPIYGAFELVKLFMAIGIFLSIPGVVLRHGHVQVHLLAQLLPSRLQRAWTGVGSVIGAAVFAIIAYGLTELTLAFVRSGEQTTLLRLPLWTVSGFMAVASLFIAIGCIVAVSVRPAQEDR